MNLLREELQNRVIFRENGNKYLNFMLYLSKNKVYTLCLCMQYRIKPIFPYFVDKFLALIYNIYVADTKYVLYCIIFGEKTCTIVKKSFSLLV